MFVCVLLLVFVLGEGLLVPITTRRDLIGLVASSLSGAPATWSGTSLRLVSPREATFGDLAFARYPDPVLRVEANPVLDFDNHLERTVSAMKKTCRVVGAVGLAATQCAVDARVVVMRDQVYCNPRIVHRSDETEMRCWRERCLVLPPDVLVETLRDREIVVEALDLSGNRFTRTLSGEPARAFQHEYDHMRGILIVDHAADLVSSHLFPPLEALEAPYHHKRRTRAWERSIG